MNPFFMDNGKSENDSINLLYREIQKDKQLHKENYNMFLVQKETHGLVLLQ